MLMTPASLFRRVFFLSLLHIFVVVIATPVHAGHRDPAPIPDEVITQLVGNQQPKDDPLLVALSRHLDEATDMLDKLNKESSGDKSDLTTRRMLLRSNNIELGVIREELRSRFAATRTRLSSMGLSEQVAAWDRLFAKAEERFERIGKSLEEVRSATDHQSRRKALEHARKEMHELHGKLKEKEQTLGGAPLPTWTFENRPFQSPDYNHAAPPSFILSMTRNLNNIYAFNGNTLLAPVPDPVPSEALSCGYTSADLGENQEIRLTAEIRELAKQLEYSPARILEYVSNEIRFEPYYGSMKGAAGTLVAKSGNATDQTSLLIALLRASNIPARYVKGTVNSANEERLLRWLGVKTQTAAAHQLNSGGIPTNLDAGTGTVQFTHVWAEACVPYAHYRGAKYDNAGFRWIPLDPSIKDKTYQAGIATNVNFDYTSYMATRTDDLPVEAYEQQVGASVKSLPPNYNNNTLEDVPYKGVPLQCKVDILPASPPYEVVNFPPWGGGIITSDTAEVPDSHRVKFAVTAKDSGGASLAATTLSLPESALARTTLSYKGATAGDQTMLDNWKSDGNPDSNIPCTVNVVPVIKSEGVDKAVGTTAVDICTTNNQLTLSVSLAELTNPTLNSVTFSNIGAANYHSLLAYAFQTSDRLIGDRSKRLLDTVRATANPMTNIEETEGEFLNIVGLKYLRYISDANKRIGELDGGTGESGNHLGLTCARTKVKYLFDLPFAVNRAGFLVDVPGGKSRNRDISTGNGVWKTFKLSGYNSSAYESYIWQENSRLDAVSTVRGIQYARETGIEVLTLTSANWSAAGDETTCANVSSQCYKFTHNSNSSLNYAPSQVSSIYSGFISQGYTLTVPRSLIQYQTWKGAVFIGERNNLAVDGTMSGTYAINQYAGGYTVSTPISYSYDPVINTGYVLPSTGTITTTAPLYIGNGAISTGMTQYNTFAGDPVNMINGNVYHTERDLSIKGRGGFPIVFERSYNSRNPQDGPLGFGWTHSFNHYLTFKDDNYNGTTESADTDNATSAVSWMDGTGAEKFIRVAGNSGGVPIGSTFTPPKGFYFQMSRAANGTYTIREKNGLTYTFESMAGTVNQKARLTAISDRNNNTLTLAYPAGRVTITDGLGRVITLTYTGSRISEVSDWSGRRHQYGYDGNGNLTSYRNPLAVAGTRNPVTYDYYGAGDGVNLNHAMKKYTLPRGNGMTFEYYANGRAFRHFNTLGETNTFTYNDFRRETVQVNERGFARHFFFDEYGNPEKIVEENGAVRTYTYDPANPYNRLSKKDPEGYLTQYAYDGSGNVIQITNPSGATTTFSNFTAYNQPGKVKDARGNHILNKYDANGNLLQKINLRSGVGAAIDPAAYVPVAADIVSWTVNSYDSYGNPLTSRRVRDFAAQAANPANLAGPTLEYGYNDTLNNVQNLNMVSITRRGDKNGDGVIASGEVDTASLSYDSLGRLKTGVDADWQPTSFTYDSVDRVTRGSDSLGYQRDYSFDDNGNPTGQRLTITYNAMPSLLDSGSFGYDESDRKAAFTDAGGNATAYKYDEAGNVIKMTNPDNYTLSFEYDPNNRAIKAYDQEGNSVTKNLDLTGKPRSITDPNRNTTTYEYYDATKDGRLKKVTLPKIQAFAAGRAVQYDYDANGNIISVTDIPADGSASRTTLTIYDELNRPTRIVGPVYTDATLGAIRPVTRYAYDKLGNRQQVLAGRTDSSGTTPANDVVTTQMTFLYDDFGRKLRETDALGNYWRFVYDMNNNVSQVTDAKGQATGYTWGYGHQLLTRTGTAGNTTYTRNVMGQITRAQTPEVTYTFTYDTAHRLSTMTDSRGNKTLAYDWSPGGRLNTVTDSEENETDYLYDPVGRLSAIWAANNDTVTFKYDAGGRLVEKWFPNGVTARYAYNADNSLQQVVNRSSSSTIISRHDYTYDGAGNRLTHTEMIGATTTSYSYLYDALNRLTQVGNGSAAQQENYAYDPLNNRTTKRVNATSPEITAYVYDAANQLNEIRQGSTSGPILATLSYDDNGNRYQKTEGSTTTAISYDALNRVAGVTKTGLDAQSYEYDDQGRRISKTVVGVTTNYLYNGPDIYGEYSDWAEAAAIYTHGPNMDDPIIRETGTATQYFHQDGLGSVVALSDQAGATVGTQRFDAWGNRLAGTGTIPQYGYTGREPDETGLVYYRARYYDPSIGRFTQRDPVGLQGGINQYAYVEGNPVNQTDPEGLVSVGSVQVADNTYFNNYGTDAGGTSVGSKLLQGTHYALDAVNLFADGPAALIGASAGVIDAGIYWLEGKKLDAGLSLAGAVPVVGIAATVGRYGGKAVDGAGSLIQANRAAGQVGENFLAKTYGGAQQVTKSTSLGTRVIDNLVDATAMESKVGRTSLTSTVRNQIAKDSELLMSPLSRVDAIEWHFFLGKTGLGPTAPLKKALEDALFKIEIH